MQCVEQAQAVGPARYTDNDLLAFLDKAEPVDGEFDLAPGALESAGVGEATGQESSSGSSTSGYWLSRE